MPTTSNFGWTTPADTDLVKDGALAIRTLGNGIDTSMAQLKGGTTGQVLSKTSNTDMAFTWVTQDDANAIQNAIVDAKGDLIAATANDTPARLAVGSDGSTLVADSSATTGLRWQEPRTLNGVINGGMDIWQRGTSVAGSTTGFLADRWRAYRNASGSTFSRQTSGLANIQYSLRCQRDSGNTFTNSVSTFYTSESADAFRFAGKTVVLSFWAKAGANFSASSSALNVGLQTGTGIDQAYGSFTGASNVISTTATLTTSWQRFSFTATFGSTVTQYAIDIGYSATGTASTNDWFEITGVQLEVGSVATPFQRSAGTLAGELAACQRYCINYPADGAYNRYGGGLNYSTTKCNANIPLPVEMRTTPSLTTTGTASNYAVNHGADTVTACSAVPAINGAGNSKKVASVDATVASGLTAGAFGVLLSNNNTTSYLLFTAEL